jgi:hypothetical protein
MMPTLAVDLPLESAAAHFFALHNETARFRRRCSERQQSGVARNPALKGIRLIYLSYFFTSDLARRL